MRLRKASEQGAVAPTSLLAIAIAAVAIGAAGYALTVGTSDKVEQPPTVQATATPSPTPRPSPTAAPVLNRGQYQVTVYNHTLVSGLAKRTAEKASTLGWNVLSSAQWRSNIDATTVYYGPGLKAAADQLGTDLGITKVAPAIDPMAPDQLTVILADDYATQ